MKDIVSISKAFLNFARQHADDPVAPLATGFSQDTLKALQEMSIEQIDALADSLPLSVFSMRLNADQIKLAVEDERNASRFMIAAVAAQPQNKQQRP